MMQLLVFGIVILLFILAVMLFSHSQSLQRFAVMEFLLVVAVTAVAYMGFTKAKSFMTTQYLSLFGVYISGAQDYAGELEQLTSLDSAAAWQTEGDDLQNLLEQSLPVTKVDGEQSCYLTAAVYERLSGGEYAARVLRQTKNKGCLSEEDCRYYIEQLANTAIQSKSVVSGETKQGTGVLVYADRRSVAPKYILLTEISLAPVQADIANMQREFLVYGAAFLLVASILLALVIFLQGRQMRSLVRVTARVAEGKEDWDSLKNSADSFWIESNEMRRLKNSLGQISTDVARMNYIKYKVLQNYYRFAPKQIEQILGKYSILEVEPGDNVHVTGTLAFVAYPENRGLGEDQHLRRMDREYKRLGEKQKEYEGILLSDNSDLTTLQLLFREETRKALYFGLEIAAPQEGEVREPAFVLLHRTAFMYGVIGNDEQAFTYMLSREMKMLEKYVEQFRSMGIRMAVTDAVYELVEKETTGRYIGYLEEGGCTFKLYEILDAYPAKERQRRLDTKDKFRKALNLFYQGDYYLGRNLFTEVLKECPDDEVAKWYLFLCEKCLNTDYGRKVSCALFSE